MGRSKTDAEICRPEVRLLKDHAATRRLLARGACARCVAPRTSNLLVAREAALNGRDYNRLLWVPSKSPAPQDTPVLDRTSTGGAGRERRSGRLAETTVKRVTPRGRV